MVVFELESNYFILSSKFRFVFYHMFCYCFLLNFTNLVLNNCNCQNLPQESEAFQPVFDSRDFVFFELLKFVVVLAGTMCSGIHFFLGIE